MPAYDLVSGSKYAMQGDKIKLAKSVYFSSTKKIVNPKGRWYYEFTHYSNGTNFDLVGFAFSGYYIAFYPMGNNSRPMFYMYPTVSTKNNQIYYLPFSVESEHTVGLGIDTIKKRMYAFYNKNFEMYEFNQSIKIKNLIVQAWGSSDPRTNDNVSVNFGRFPFVYSIPGFKPWGSNAHFNSCLSNHISRISNISLVFMLLLVSR